jgi:hypothetical protein
VEWEEMTTVRRCLVGTRRRRAVSHLAFCRSVTADIPFGRFGRNTSRSAPATIMRYVAVLPPRKEKICVRRVFG